VPGRGARQSAGAAIPEEVRQAILEYLQASSRLAGMQAESYVFAPPANVERGETDSREARRFTKYRLRHLPLLPPDEEGSMSTEGCEPRVPSREPVHFKPGEGLKHGFYARGQPAEAVQRILAENIRGADEEIIGLRSVARELMERMDESGSSDEAVRLGEAYSLTAYRLRVLIEAERRAAERAGNDADGESWSDQILSMLATVAEQIGESLDREAVRRQALEGTPGLEVSNRKLEEEIAGLRLVLRNTLRLALQAEGAEAAIRLADIHGHECLRLLRLLSQEKNEGDRLEAYLREQIDEAFRELGEQGSRSPGK
ncbi:MAG TPA: hypothetical protein VJ436_12795, partial [Anaerolineales bacterium]|nr:hypothetical protein [Anaerolineales bacterium]